MLLRAWIFAVAVVGASGYGLAYAEQNLSTQQAAAQKERAALQQRISTLQKDIESTQSDKKDVATALRDVESRISSTDSELTALTQRQTRVQAQLADLQQQIQTQQRQQEQEQAQLAEQLRAQYASGLSPWTALLSGNDPQQIQRELGYLGYVSKAQAEQVRSIQQGMLRLEQLQTTAKANQVELTQLAAATTKQREQLVAQQAERQGVLAQIDAALKAQQQQARTLTANDARLGSLITGLEKEIAHQAELRRQAEARRQAEQARLRAEAARKQAEQAKRLAAAAEEERRLHALAHTPAQPAPEPAAELAGLRRGMAPPVRGEIQGRFGTERPEGGPWRGIIFRAATGTPVQAIAAGQVVFSNWMAGFGNLLIIDHGNGFLSVYGHNQSLLKQVGDSVAAGDAIARVGATGGQIESGVYFEIRQNGQPVNPQIWLGS